MCVLGILVILCVLEVLILPAAISTTDIRELSVKISVSCHKIILFFCNGYVESCLQGAASPISSLASALGVVGLD